MKRRRPLKNRRILERKSAFRPARDDHRRRIIPGDLVIDFSVFEKNETEKLKLKIAKSQVKNQ
jgi:hypothetical protein